MNFYQKLNYVLGNKKHIIYILIINLFFSRILELIGIVAIVSVCTSFIGNEYSDRLSFLSNISDLSFNIRLLVIFSIIFARSIVLLFLRYYQTKLLFNFSTDLRSSLIFFYLERPLYTLNEEKSSSYIQSAYESVAKVNTFLYIHFLRLQQLNNQLY